MFTISDFAQALRRETGRDVAGIKLQSIVAVQYPNFTPNTIVTNLPGHHHRRRARQVPSGGQEARALLIVMMLV